MLETFCLSVLGSGGVAGIFFALIRHYIERRLMLFFQKPVPMPVPAT